MKVKLNDTLHFADIRRDPFVADDTVDLPDAQARSLIDRGLASKVAAKAQRAAPKNKAEGASRSNKAGASARRSPAPIGSLRSK